MLYRFSICRKGPPPCRFKLVSGDVALDGCGAAPGQLQGSTACFRIIAGLVSYRPELQLRKLDTLRGCRFGELGLTEKPASRHEHANKPQPTKFAAATKPQQNTHHNHASQVLSCSFKPAAPYAQELQIPKTGTPAQQNRYPSNPQGFKFGGLGFKDRHVTASPKCWQNTAEASPLTCEPQPTTCAAALHN